jgi:SPP1 family predicted phage head-tail adaptor
VIGALQAGLFRHRLELQANIGTPDGLGGFQTTWTRLFDVWARLEPVGAGASVRTGALHDEISHRITLRYRSGISPGMRLIAPDRIFEIDAVFDPDESHRYLICMARETE